MPFKTTPGLSSFSLAHRDAGCPVSHSDHGHRSEGLSEAHSLRATRDTQHQEKNVFIFLNHCCVCMSVTSFCPHPGSFYLLLFFKLLLTQHGSKIMLGMYYDTTFSTEAVPLTPSQATMVQLRWPFCLSQHVYGYTTLQIPLVPLAALGASTTVVLEFNTSKTPADSGCGGEWAKEGRRYRLPVTE